MLNAEHIHDALSLLPDDLLEPVDALRRKKRVPWRSLTAVAACLCLVAGLWLLFPGGATSMDSANGSAEGYSGACDTVTQESVHGKYLTATVLAVEEDRILVLPGEKLPANVDISIHRGIAVNLTQLEHVPELKPRQFIRIYCDEIPEEFGETVSLSPTKIEIMENEGG